MPAFKNIWIIDSTLRDGEQTPGVVFSKDEKIWIAKKLSEMGVHELEVGTPSMGGFEVNDIKEITKLNLDCRLTAWCRAKDIDIEKSAETGVDAVHISFPTSDLHLKSIGKDRKWVLEEADRLIRKAKDRFQFVSFGALDGSRTKLEFLKDFIKTSRDAGAQRFRLADTVGILNPYRAFMVMRKIKEFDKELIIDFHGHNDLGMATANTLCAIRGGASAVSVTIGGIGERAGNAALEEIVMALKISEGIDVDINTGMFTEVCNYVSNAAKIPFAKNKPIVGELVLKHESGIHCKNILYDRGTYEIFKASDIGREEEDFVIGKHSGKAGIIEILKKHGIDVDDKAALNILKRVKELAMIKKGEINFTELKYIYDKEKSRSKIWL